MKTGIELIAKERVRQVSKEGWTHKHDDEHTDGEIALFGAHYAILAALQANSHLDLTSRHSMILNLAAKETIPKGWSSNPKGQLKNLVRAGALIAAEIDRLNRK